MQRRFLFLSDHFVGVDAVFTYKLSNIQPKVSFSSQNLFDFLINRRLIIRLDEAQEYIECLQERFQQMEKE